MSDWVGILVLLLMIFLNGFFVAAEYALVSVRRTRIDQLVEEGNSVAKTVQRALKNINFYVAAVQLGITITALLTGIVGERSMGNLLEAPLDALGLSHNTVKTIAFVIAIVVSAFLSIVFAELVPKSIALQRSEQTVLSTILPLSLFTAFFGPVARMLNTVGGAVLRLFGIRPVLGHTTGYSEEEIRMIVSASSQEGVLEEDEKELLYNVFDFSDTAARAIMTPRVDMISIESGASLARLIALHREHGYSRVPVYVGSTDKITGVAHVADCLKHLGNLERVTVNQIMRKAINVPETMKVLDLFKEIQAKKQHLAIVVDEFGGTAGLVTLEDLLEELVGEIYDESDDVEESGVKHLEDGTYLLDASMSFGEVEEALGIQLHEEDEGEFDTLAGFASHSLGHLPLRGEEFEYKGWVFSVEKADDRRVLSLRAVRRADTLPVEQHETTEPNPSDAN